MESEGAPRAVRRRAYHPTSDLALLVADQEPGDDDSYALVDRLEEVEKNGKIYREQTSRVISHGIAASVNAAREWLDEQLVELSDVDIAH